MNWTPTPSQTVGPYLHLGLTDRQSVPCLVGEGCKGERLSLTFRVLDGEGVPVPDAMIEIWQADSDGNYQQERLPVDRSGFCGFGRLATGEDGCCTFETVMPGCVAGPMGHLQAPHINVSILGRGLLKRLSTRAYFAGDEANAHDPVLGLVPEHRRKTLLANADLAGAGRWILDIRLSGEGETVFFDA